MTTNTAGLSFADAASAAVDSELSLSDESGVTDITPEPVVADPIVEQPAVETKEKAGLFDSLSEQTEKPKGESAELIEVDGEVMSLDKLRSGYMMQADYTQKTQELADKMREADKALTLLRLLEERPLETVTQLYQAVKTGAPITGIAEAKLTTQPSEPQTAPSDIEALVEARVAEMLKNDPRLVQVENDQALVQVNEIFSEIEKMYNVTLTDSDKERTLQEAVDRNTDDLKFVFGGLMNQANQKEIALRNAKASASVIPVYAPPNDQQPVVTEKHADFRSAVNAALAAEQVAEQAAAR